MEHLDPELLDIIACPCAEHAPLDVAIDGDSTVLRCVRCYTTFPVKEGIPVLLLDEATEGPRGIGVAIED